MMRSSAKAAKPGDEKEERRREMDQMMSSVGTYWFGKKAGKELSLMGDELSSISDSIEEGAKWLVNKAKGKTQKPLPDLLQEHDLPKGLFPRDVTRYEFDAESGRLTVFIPSVCEVSYRDESMLRFFSKVKGNLEKGRLSQVEGIKTKVLIWLKVTSIFTEGPTVNFTVGLKRARTRTAYEGIRDGIIVDKF
ncbi:hypothetical protein HPP92_015068 [Vanilla planifolia]|uniref:Uncharacterized protein n=1 Tax=Vanilla planifolia TaxID=51239 RepID=A0A835QV58_VANPL|nr:hypothetical protein HPP92_015068 [Vanilla planifolia]